MNISAEAIEAAANAISQSSGMRFDGFWSRIEDLEPEDREYALKEARAALEAAAPYLKAEAWDEGADSEFRRSALKQQRDSNPYRGQA